MKVSRFKTSRKQSSRKSTPKTPSARIYVPHTGWLCFPPADEVLKNLREGWYEYSEQAFLWSYLRESDSFLDIGAHVGLFSALATRVIGAAGQIHAVEPNPEVIPYLRANTADGKLKIHTLALSDRSGHASLAQGNENRTAYSSIAYDIGDEKKVRVRTKTLDDFMESEKIGTVALAKLDVEGSELAVLKGAQKTLRSRRVLAFMVEFTAENSRMAGHSTAEIAAELIGSGYEAFRFDEAKLGLVPHQIREDVEYDNYLFTHDPSAVFKRLWNASADRQLVSEEILKRGFAAKSLMQNLCSQIRSRDFHIGERDAVKKELTALQQHLGEVNADRDARLNSITRLQGELTTVQRNLVEVSTDRDERLKTNSDLVQRLTTLQQHLGEVNADREARLRLILDLQEEERKLQQHLREVNADRDARLRSITNLQKELATVQQHLGEVNADREMRLSSIFDLQEEVRKLQQHLGEANADREARLKSITHLQEELTTVQQHLGEVNADREMRLSSIFDLQKELSRSRQQLAEVDDERNAQKALIERLETTLAEANQKLSYLSDVKESETQARSELAATEIRMLINETASAEALERASRAQSELTDAKYLLEKLCKQLQSELDSARSNLSTQIDSMSKELRTIVNSRWIKWGAKLRLTKLRRMQFVQNPSHPNQDKS